MQALSALSPIASIEARIQARVAKFLGLKIILVKLTKHSSLSVKSRATALYTAQQIYEKQLQEALAKIEQIKVGAYTYSDIIGLGTFVYDLETHIGNVEKLQKDAGYTVEMPSLLPSSTIVMVGAGVAILGVLYFAFRK